MAHKVKVLVTKADDLSLIPELHMLEGKLTPTSCPLTSTLML